MHQSDKGLPRISLAALGFAEHQSGWSWSVSENTHKS